MTIDSFLAHIIDYFNIGKSLAVMYNGSFLQSLMEEIIDYSWVDEKRKDENLYVCILCNQWRQESASKKSFVKTVLRITLTIGIQWILQ